MKKLFTILTAVLLTATLWAQSPEKMSYQAVIRDASDNLVTNQTVGMQISILQGSTSGTAVYVETQTPTTNANGLVSIEIGTGTVVSGDFTIIDWASGPFFIKTETDPAGNTSYTITGTSQLLSVPYALHAKTAETVTETDPVYDASVASGITATDTSNWNNKLGSYTETQTLGDVAAIGNAVNTQLKNVTNPTEDQDAATKSYVTLRVSTTGDTLFLGEEQWVIIPDIGVANISFQTVSDIDGNIYKTVLIDTMEWMAENLKTLHFSDGTEIPLITDNTTWKNSTTPAYCWYDNDSVAYADPYGAMYNKYAINTGKLCPSGWHVATQADWNTLTALYGGNSSAGGALKSTGTVYWNSPNTGATNITGFSGLPGGQRLSSDGTFASMGERALFWCGDFNLRWLEYNNDDVTTMSAPSSYGFSVRCIKD